MYQTKEDFVFILYGLYINKHVLCWLNDELTLKTL